MTSSGFNDAPARLYGADKQQATLRVSFFVAISMPGVQGRIEAAASAWGQSLLCQAKHAQWGDFGGYFFRNYFPRMYSATTRATSRNCMKRIQFNFRLSVVLGICS